MATPTFPHLYKQYNVNPNKWVTTCNQEKQAFVTYRQKLTSASNCAQCIAKYTKEKIDEQIVRVSNLIEGYDFAISFHGISKNINPRDIDLKQAEQNAMNAGFRAVNQPDIMPKVLLHRNLLLYLTERCKP